MEVELIFGMIAGYVKMARGRCCALGLEHVT